MNETAMRIAIVDAFNSRFREYIKGAINDSCSTLDFVLIELENLKNSRDYLLELVEKYVEDPIP